MLDETKKVYAVLLRIASVAIILSSIMIVLKDKVSELTVGLSFGSDYSRYMSVLIKGVVVSIVTGVCSDICAESGSSSIAKIIQFAGRVMVFILSYPLVEAIITIAVSFAGG